MDPMMLLSLGSGLLKGLGGLFGGNEERKLAERNNQLINAFDKQATGFIDTGHNDARDYLSEIYGQYTPLVQQGTSLASLYSDAMGANGADGNARATAAFQAGPGYQFTMDQGLKALERRAGAQGRLQSGQTGIDTLNYATGLANQEYGDWLEGLRNPGSIITGSFGGRAGALGDLAGLSTQTSDRRLNLASEVLNGRMGVNQQKTRGTQQMIGAGFGGLSNMLGSLAGGYS